MVPRKTSISGVRIFYGTAKRSPQSEQECIHRSHDSFENRFFEFEENKQKYINAQTNGHTNTLNKLNSKFSTQTPNRSKVSVHQIHPQKLMREDTKILLRIRTKKFKNVSIYKQISAASSEYTH